jgi:TatA/E family protein of Tat protein translocase
MFGSIGGPELFLILVIALIVFGPRKLPEIGKSLGKMMAEFRRASNDFKQTIEDEVEAERRTQTPPAPPALPPAPPAGVVAQDTPTTTSATSAIAPELEPEGTPRS